MREKNLNKDTGTNDADDDVSSDKLILVSVSQLLKPNYLKCIFVNFSDGNIRRGCCSTGTGCVLPVHRGPHRK